MSHGTFDITISILAVLADRDVIVYSFKPTSFVISILAVLADRDLIDGSGLSITRLFQSSRSLRTATFQTTFQSILGDISILAVLADRDERAFDGLRPQIIFQSSRSLRTATWPLV